MPVPPPPPPPPQDSYAGPAPTCVPPVPPASLTHQELITRVPHDSTSVSALFKAHKGITEHTPARQGPVKGTSATGVSSDPSNDETGDDISRVTAPLNGIGVPATPQAPGPNGGGNLTETAPGGSDIHGGGGGGGLPPGVPAECDPNGNGFSELVSGQVSYGSTVMSQMIQAIRLENNDTRGNYAIGCLEDGTIVIGRSSSDTLHAERDVVQQAGFRRIVDLYSEREPCPRCAGLTRGVNTSWSFEWNPSEVRPQSTINFQDAMNELFRLP